MSFRLSSFLSVAGACALLSVASGARADAAAAAPASAAPPLPAPSAAPSPPGSDLVRLRDGSMIRGTISELTVGGDVVILTLTGETRRVAMSDVEYAGPASGAKTEGAAPASAPPASGEPAVTAQDGDRVPVKVVANEEELTVQLRNGSGTGFVYGRNGGQLTVEQYQPICVAPCRALVPRGGQTLAASLPGHGVVAADHPIHIDGPGTLNVTYNSKQATRVAALVIAAAGAATALIAPIVAVATEQDCDVHSASFQACMNDDSARTNTFVAAAIGGGVAIVALFVAILSRDTVTFELSPYAAAPPAVAGPDVKAAAGPHASLQLTRSGVGLAF